MNETAKKPRRFYRLPEYVTLPCPICGCRKGEEFEMVVGSEENYDTEENPIEYDVTENMIICESCGVLRKYKSKETKEGGWHYIKNGESVRIPKEDINKYETIA